MSSLRLRIVYDGPAEAGKTTSVKSLAHSLEVSVVSPAKRGERTLFFDWSEYRGGRFGGAPIHCQLVSVPGQQQLFERRKLILETADVVVFVADSRPERVQASRASLEQLLQICQQAGRRAPRILIQANKRDLPEAVPLVELTGGLLNHDTVPILETTATQAAGIRQGFVYAVRLGLERARELDAQNLLAWDGDESHGADSAESLFALVSDSMEWVDGSALVDGDTLFVDRESPSTVTTHRRLEDARPGSVWPPIEGRMYLREAQKQQISWIPWRNQKLGVGPEWLFHREPTDSFETDALAREQLIRLAQRHISVREWVGPERCLVVLPDDKSSRSCIWQIARRVLTLRELVDGLVWESPSPLVAMDALAKVWNRLEKSFDELSRAPLGLQVGLDNLQAAPDQSRLVGILRFQDGVATDERARAELGAVVAGLKERHAVSHLEAAAWEVEGATSEFRNFVLAALAPTPSGEPS